jgi:uncharacterized protein YndB with AHSA1/START domain
MKNDPFVIERTYNAPISKVWKALTDRNEMKQWYFDLAEFSPEVGFEFLFLAGNDKKKYLHRCKISEVLTGEKLTYSWQYDGYAGISYVSFELFDESGKTRLKLTHRGIETFPLSNPDFAQERFAEGWTHIVGTALKEFVEESTVNEQ